MADTIFTCTNGNQIISPSARTGYATDCLMWHPMDEVSLPLVDRTGNGRNMTDQLGSPIYHQAAFGAFGLQTDGPASVYNNAINPGNNINAFSLLQLVNQSGFGGAVYAAGAGGYVTIQYGNDYAALIMLIDTDTSSPTGDVFLGLYVTYAGTEYFSRTTNRVIKRGVEHHVCITKGTYSPVVNFYVDGILVNSVSGNGIGILPNQAITVLGAYQNWNMNGFQAHGEMWRTALTSADFVQVPEAIPPMTVTSGGIYNVISLDETESTVSLTSAGELNAASLTEGLSPMITSGCNVNGQEFREF